MQKVSTPQNESTVKTQTSRKTAEVEKPEMISQSPRGLTAISGAAAPGIPITSQNIRYLQRTIGNKAVGQLIQARLAVGKPNDKYEREADRVAEQVMKMPGAESVQGNSKPVNTTSPLQRQEEEEQEPIQAKPLAAQIIPLLQRQTEEEEEPVQAKPLQRQVDKEEEKLQMQPMEEKESLQRQPLEEEEEEMLQGRAADGGGLQVSNRVHSQIDSLRGGGRPLPESSRAFFEPRFGVDFSNVRVHTDAQAAGIARSINARAFTVGKDVAFGGGQYSPETIEGKKLLAHELTHTLQQGGRRELNRFEKLHKKDTAVKKDESNWGKMQITERTLPNGQRQQISRVPFSQLISHVATPSQENEASVSEQEAPLFVKVVEPTEELESSNLDSINATLTHVPSVAQGGAGPSGFGVTRSAMRFINVVITSGGGTYTVTGDLEHTITWQVRSATGPGGQIDIQNENDPDIKACNYQLVSSDLTPKMSSDNGRPPRTKFWAEDLTKIHELFHARDQRKLSFGPQCTTAAQNWLNSQTATSAADIRNTLLRQALNEGIRVFNALVALPTTEGDAYGDGAPLYQARADTVKSKGDVGDYGFVSAEVTNHPKGGDTYEIVRGDTLWGIAERTYGHGRYWRRIYRANPGKARRGGNLIFPGTVLNLPTINIDQELSVFLSFNGKTHLTAPVLVAGGGSHLSFILPSEIFSDTTNCTGNVDVEIWDAIGNVLLTAVWSLSGQTNARNGNIEVTVDIAP